MVVTGRQVVADFAQLFLDDIKIINQPFRGRCDHLFPLDRPGGGLVVPKEKPAVLKAARKQRPPSNRVQGNCLCGGETFRVLLEPLHAEQFSTDGTGHVCKYGRRCYGRGHRVLNTISRCPCITKSMRYLSPSAHTDILTRGLEQGRSSSNAASGFGLLASFACH